MSLLKTASNRNVIGLDALRVRARAEQPLLFAGHCA